MVRFSAKEARKLIDDLEKHRNEVRKVARKLRKELVDELVRRRLDVP